jgi:hypothetical protein
VLLGRSEKALNIISCWHSKSVGLLLLEDFSRAAVRRNQTERVKGRLKMVPSASQRRIFKAVHDRFLRRFALGRIEIGERTWNLVGDPLKVYRVYAAVREALDAIVEPQLKLGGNHVVTLTLPIRWVAFVWDPQRPAICFVPDLVLDGLPQTLSGFDPRRIKRCLECDAFFLARRLDKSACSPRCLESRPGASSPSQAAPVRIHTEAGERRAGEAQTGREFLSE